MMSRTYRKVRRTKRPHVVGCGCDYCYQRLGITPPATRVKILRDLEEQDEKEQLEDLDDEQ